jgi:cbb3-type cytochrome oxidase subunit 3
MYIMVSKSEFLWVCIDISPTHSLFLLLICLFIFFILVFLFAYLFSYEREGERERERMELEDGEVGRVWERRRETMIRIYCININLF